MAISNQDIRAALWSVHYYHHFDTEAQPLPDDQWVHVRPIALNDALHTLKASTEDNRGIPGNQIAYMRLRDAWLMHPGEFETAPLPPIVDLEEVRQAYRLETLPKRKKSGGRLMPDYTSPYQVPRNALGAIPTIHPAFRTLEVVPNSGFFDLRNYVCDITSHCATDAISAQWSIDVNRPFGAMLPVLDARNWDHCSGYVELATNQGSLLACPVNDPGPPANAGSSWTDHFCERIGTGFPSGMTFSNRLFFTFTSTSFMTITTFSDRDPAGRPTGIDPAILFDRGWIVAGPVPVGSMMSTYTRIRGYKFLKLTNPLFRTVMVPLLESWISEEIRTGTACMVP